MYNHIFKHLLAHLTQLHEGWESLCFCLFLCPEQWMNEYPNVLGKCGTSATGMNQNHTTCPQNELQLSQCDFPTGSLSVFTPVFKVVSPLLPSRMTLFLNSPNLRAKTLQMMPPVVISALLFVVEHFFYFKKYL